MNKLFLGCFLISYATAAVNQNVEPAKNTQRVLEWVKTNETSDDWVKSAKQLLEEKSLSVHDASLIIAALSVVGYDSDPAVFATRKVKRIQQLEAHKVERFDPNNRATWVVLASGILGGPIDIDAMLKVAMDVRIKPQLRLLALESVAGQSSIPSAIEPQLRKLAEDTWYIQETDVGPTETHYGYPIRRIAEKILSRIK